MLRATHLARAARFMVLCSIGVVAATAVRAETAHIVVLGTSNAAGSAVGSSAAWPAQLAAMLRAKGYDVDVSVRAVGGATSADIAGQAASIPSRTRVVVFDVGAGNDRDRRVSAERSKANREQIEARIRAAGAEPVFVSYTSIVGPQSDGSPAWIAGDRHQHISAQAHRRVAAAIMPRVIAALGKKN